jgi:hypothetical protein
MRVIFVTLIVLSNIFPQCWIATYNGPASNYDFSVNLVLGDNGCIYLTGRSKGIDCDYDYCTIKYNSSGIEEWVRRYNCPANGSDCALAIAIDCSSNVYVTGFSDSLETSDDIVTIKYNSDGELIWLARYCSPGQTEDLGSDIICDNDGNVYVTGYSGNLPQRYPIIIKYDINGIQEWAAVDTIRGWTVSIGLDDQSNVYTAGYQIVRDSARYSIIKYNPYGVIQWRAGDNILGYIYKLKVTSAGDVFVTGASGIGYTGNWQWDIVTAKYNTFGQEQWVQVYDDSVQGWDEGQSLTIDNQGNVYITGPSATQPGPVPAFDFVTIKYSSSGTEEWIRRYDGFESDDYPFDIEVDNQKNIYVGGYSAGFYNNGWSEDATIVKYDSSGSQVWVARYDGPGNNSDWINGLALDEHGYIYATGFTELYSFNTDYLTFKYPPSGPGISENLKDITQSVQITVNPNPFRKLVRFDFQPPNALSSINIKIYNLNGRVVKTFKEVKTGFIIWDGKDDSNLSLPSGIYFVNFYSNNYQFIRKVIKQN